MFTFLTKSLLVIGSCGGLAFLSTRWIKPQEIEAIHKVNFNNQEKTIKEITRIEDIDVWGQENGCNFIFVKDWKKGEVYTATGYADAKGGKEIKLGGKYGTKSWEKAIVDTVNEYKRFCGDKLKSFTFIWNGQANQFYIGNPEEKPSAKKTYFNF